MNYIWMLTAFALFTGIALLYCSSLKIHMGEGTLLSASTIIGALYLSGLAGTFCYGMYALTAFGIVGWIWYGVNCLKFKGKNVACLSSPGFIVLFIIFAYGLIAFYHDFIQHIDEFHQWAASVKYLLEKDHLIVYEEFIGGRQQYATSLFHLFFQKIAGYNEQDMYVSSLLLSWIGFMLPFANYEKKDWKKVALYCLVIFTSLYSLYYYNYKNLYVDIPTAAWAGGLAGWWMNRDRNRKKQNLLIAASGLITLWHLKSFVGMLMVVFVLLFMSVQVLFVERRILENKKITLKQVLLVAAGMGVLGICAVCGLLFWKGGFPLNFKEKFFRTTESFLRALTGKPVASASNLKIVFLPFVIGLLVLLKAAADLFRPKKECLTYGVYTVITAAGYCFVLLLAFYFIFSYEESIVTAGISRYFSVIMIYLFVIVMAVLCQRKTAKYPALPGYVMMGLLLFFMSGFNSGFISEATGLCKKDVAGYKYIKSTKEQIKKIEREITDSDKVYLINQDDETEFPTNTALYYLENQVSNYLSEPWKFTEKGSIIRLAEKEEPSLQDLPALLEAGGYTYLWIYSSDEYLDETLPQVMGAGRVEAGQFYKVVYQNGKCKGLELIE